MAPCCLAFAHGKSAAVASVVVVAGFAVGVGAGGGVLGSDVPHAIAKLAKATLKRCMSA